MPSLLEILRDPNYLNANQATKQAIFERYASQDTNYTGANDATQAAIREKFGVSGFALAEPPPPTPEPEGGFFPSVKRGFLQAGMLVGDVLPAMVGKAVGAEEYAKRQWEEAAETQRRIEKEVPAAVPSYKDISSFGDAWVYAKEAVGESIASIIPSILTGGAAGVLARPAIAAANTAAREAAEKTLMSAAMKMGPPTEVALESAKKAAVQAGIDAAKRTAFRYEVAGGLAGSALQNIPEVYQNIKEETGKEDIPAALIAGGFNAALDTILPAQVLKKIRGQGLSETEVMAAWYKRGATGLGKGLLIEGATEAAQEASSILAENFVAENSDVFNGKNLERVINAGIKGGIGGGVITAATDIATGKAPPKEQTDRQQIEQLQREIAGDIETARAEQALEEAENAKKAAEQAEEARKEAERAPTVPEIFAIARGENGYGALEAEKQRLLELKEKTTDVKKAIEIIKETQDRLVIESQERKTPPVPAVMDDQTIRSLGFVKSDKETSVYKQLLGKSTADPDVTAFLQNYAETKARPQTKERINTFLGRIERAQIPLTAEEVARGEERAGEIVTEPSGAGAPVVGEPGAGAPAAGVGITQPSGVVPSVAPVGEPPAGEGVQPAAVAAPSAPPVEPPAAEPLVSLPPRLQNITPAERNLYNFNQSLAEAQLPITGFDFERISDAPSPDGRGMTPERLVLSLEGALSAVKDLDGKLRSKNRTGATVSQLIDQWKTASQIQARINQSKQDTPELWNNYAARQKELGGLKVGDRIQIETGEIGRLDAKFPKNWRIVFDEPTPGILAGTKILRPKESLRPAVAPTPAAPTPAAAPAPTPAAPATEQQAAQQHAVKGLPIVEAPLDQIALSKDVPQFKSEADEAGIVKALEGKFERTGVAPIQLWRRTDGRLEVISGRHRFDLAKRSGETTIPAQIHDEAAGFDAKKAATLDAELNIRDEQGEVKDYVVYFEKSGITEQEAKSRGLLGRPIGQRGWAIASKGSPELIASHRAGVIPDDAAAGIAEAAPGDARLQAAGIRAAQQGKNTATVVNTVQAVKALAKDRGISEEQAGDLFGFDDSAIKEAEDMARVATQKQQELSSRLSAITGAAKKPEIAKREGIDIKDPDALNKRIQELRRQKAAWNNWSSSPDLINEIKQTISGEKPSLAEVTVPKPVKLSKETQAKIEKLGGLLEKMLGKMGLKNVAVNLVQDLERNGEYANRLIKLALDSELPVRDLRHEGLHAMKELGFFSDAQWKTLEKMARDKWIDKYLKSRQSVYNGQTMSRYDAYMRLYNGNEDLIIEEAIADAFGDFDATKPPPGLMQAILFRMREVFRNIKEAMGMANLDSAEDIFRRVERGELKETAPAVEAPARASLRAPKTEAFKRWFGDSKVVDAEGKPLVVYHGTTRDFSEFSKRGIRPNFTSPQKHLGFFFTDDPNYADRYTSRWGEFRDGAQTMPVFLSLQNPKVEPIEKIDEIEDRMKQGEAKAYRAALEAQGFDGVVFEGQTEGGFVREFVAFKPTQIKSATGNIGTYDITKPDIRYSLRDAARVDLDRSLNNKRVSPRLPTAVKATEDPMGKVRLQPDLSTFKRDPVAFRHNIGLMSQYPNFSKMKGTADQRAEQMIEHMKDNLLWLFNNWDDKLRDRSKLWYVGGNRIAHRWADKYGIPAEQAAAVIAALSPQKDWFQNVSLAERTLDALVFNADTAWTPEMTRVFRERAWAKKFPLGKYEGKTLKEMYSPGDAKSLVDMAVWIRAWDEANNPQTARVITPEGTFTNEVASGKPDKSGERKPIAMRAQSFAAMVKTLQMLQQTDIRVISDLIGKNHKVRSFYNNIIAPYAGDDVTIDTHAVAAALMRPLGSSDLEVYHNFGSAKPAKKDKEGNILVPASAGTKNSAITGLYGTYAMYAEAYRRAAREAGVLPREMQSITWEAIRGLFRPEQKQAALKQRTNVIWNRVSRGELSGQDARAQISKLVSGIEDPAWVRSPVGANESPTDSSYATELPRTGVPGGRPAEPAGRVGERVAGAIPKASLREVPRANLRDQVDIKILQRVDQTTVPREEKSFAKRINEAIAPKNFSRLRQLALNRYEGLSRIDRMKIEQMGGVDLLADASAESAALMSDMGAGITASALGVHDRKGGAPVYKRYFVVEVNGRTLSKKYQDKAAAEAAANNVNGVVRERGFTTVSNFNDSIKGPVAIFAPLMAKYKDPEIFRMFQLYSGIKRGARFMYTLDANGNAIEKLFTQDDLTNVFPRLEAQFPEFKEVHADWIKYNDKLVDFMRDTGIISAQNAETFKMHGDYFPFYRQLEMDEDAVGPRIFQSIAAVKAPKKLKGSEIALGDFLENIVRNTQSAVQAGIKNVASRRAAQMGIDVGVVQELPIGVTPDPVNSFYVLENGLKKFYETGDHLFIESIKSLNLPDMPFIGMLAGPANLLRNLVTKDPGFILANLMRDSMSAWTTSGVKMTPLVDTARNFAKALASGSPEYEALLNAGIIGGYEFSQNVQTSAKEFGASIRKAAGVPTVTEQIAKPVTSLWQALEKATTASDAATRMEIYKKTLAETGNEAEALYRALEVMNFNRKGSSAIVRLLTAAVPFLNARMQGLDILYRAAIAPSVRGTASERERQIQKTFFVRGSMIMALSAMYWALTHDDEEYKKQEQETRDNYWLLPSLGIKIPIPFEVGVLFKVIPERILAYTMGSDTGKDFLDSMKRQLLNTLAFNPIPQTFIPVFETVTNFSFFTWRPIVPQGMENVAPEYQVGPGTSKLAEGIGKALNLSPMKIDQLINGYTGTMGMYAVDLMDAIYNTMADSPKPSKRFEQMPVIKRFAVDPDARGTVTAYYDLKNAVDQVVRTENLLERTMDYENWGPYVQENMRLLASQDYVNDMEKTLKELREMKIMIRSSNMSADGKRDSLKQIGQMENALTSNIQELKKAYR